MAADPLDQVLRLVSEGRLTAEEAAPILAALDAQQVPPAPEMSGTAADEPPRGPGDPHGPAPTSLRIEIRDGGRQVVNLRLPIAIGRFALDRVPGLSGEQVDRVREALREGMRGPVLVVDDNDHGGVRIVLE